MKLTTMALAIAFALPTVSAFAEGTLNFSTPVARPVVGGVTVNTAHAFATRPPNISGNTLAPITGDPSGSTLVPAAMNRGR
jgi:hypothetical protein